MDNNLNIKTAVRESRASMKHNMIDLIIFRLRGVDQIMKMNADKWKTIFLQRNCYVLDFFLFTPLWNNINMEWDMDRLSFEIT